MTESKRQNPPLDYAGVSTYVQALDAQLAQLRKAECTKIYRGKVTGARADRRELLKLLKAIGPSDVVAAMRIDRLARSTFDLFAIVTQIVDSKGQFQSRTSYGQAVPNDSGPASLITRGEPTVS
jgi:hypothetical protein